MTEQKERCDKCKWYHDYHKDDMPVMLGECRRHAPTPILIVQLPDGEDTENYIAVFPEMLPGSFCGEFTPLCDTPRNYKNA